MLSSPRSLLMPVALVVLASLPACSKEQSGDVAAAQAASATSPQAAAAATGTSAATASAAAPSAPPPDVPALAAKCKQGDQGSCSAACDANDMPSCVKFGEAFATIGQGPSKKCLAPLRKACDAKLGRGCFALSQCIAVAGGFKDESERAALDTMACDLGDGFGCSASAEDYKNGKGVPRDAAKAKELDAKGTKLLTEACDGGAADACSFLAMQYEFGTTVPKNPTKAATLYKKACDGGDKTGCAGAERTKSSRSLGVK